jgi:hypothetical protein
LFNENILPLDRIMLQSLVWVVADFSQEYLLCRQKDNKE